MYIHPRGTHSVYYLSYSETFISSEKSVIHTPEIVVRIGGENIAKDQEIQIQVDHTAGSSGPDTLAGETASIVESGHSTGMLQDFLMKRVRAMWALTGGVAGELFLIGMARGDATVTEIKAALEDIQLERDRTTQASKRKVLHETLKLIGAGTTTEGTLMVEIDVALGGGKGIPFEKTDGWSWFIYNVLSGAASNASQVISGQSTYYGIWL